TGRSRTRRWGWATAIERRPRSARVGSTRSDRMKSNGTYSSRGPFTEPEPYRWPPNDHAHLPGGRGELRTPESLHARRVRCSEAFGGVQPPRQHVLAVVEPERLVRVRHLELERLVQAEPIDRGRLPVPAEVDAQERLGGLDQEPVVDQP